MSKRSRKHDSLDPSQLPLKPTLRPAKLRISRAGEHVGVIEAMLKEARKRNDNAEVIIHTDANLGPPTIDWSKAPRFPTTRIAIVAGEALYNARAALDYLVFSLAWLDSKEPQVGTQFPIEDKEQVFCDNRLNTYLFGVSDEHVALIKRLQPFDGCDWTRKLRTLSNPDKHRTLTADITEHASEFTASKENLEAIPGRPGRYKMKMDRVPTAKVTFFDGSPVLETLHVLVSQVAYVLQEFQPIFGERDTFNVRDLALKDT